MKNQRSSTFSSPVDSYMIYSQDSIDLNAHSLNRNNQLDESPFQKLKGIATRSFYQKTPDSNKILHTSPFLDNSSSVGLPITYLNLAHNPSQSISSVNQNNSDRGVEFQPTNLLMKFAQSQEIIKQKNNDKNKQSDQNNENTSSYYNKIGDTNTHSDFHSGVNTGTFGGSIREDTFPEPNSFRQQKEINTHKTSTNSYESPYSKNISTDYKTSQSMNENQGSIGRSKLSSLQLSQITGSPLQQIKQQTMIADGRRQYDYKMNSPYQKLFTQEDQPQQDYQIQINPNKSSMLIQNENITIPRLQSSEPFTYSQMIGQNTNGQSNQKMTNQQSTSPIRINSIFNTPNNNNNSFFANSNNASIITQNFGGTPNPPNQYTVPAGISDNFNINKNQVQNNVYYKASFFSQNETPTRQPKFQQVSGGGSFVEEDKIKKNPNFQAFFKKQFTFQQQNSKDYTVGDNATTQWGQQVNQINSMTQNTQPNQAMYSQSKFNTSQLRTDISQQMPSSDPKNQIQESHLSTISDFYEQMLRQNDKDYDEVNENVKSAEKQNNSQQYGDVETEEEKAEEYKKYQNCFINSRFKNQYSEEKGSLNNSDLDRISSAMKDSGKNNSEQFRDIFKLQSERDHLQEFVKNMEVRNSLLNERIHLLETNLQSLNTQNIDNIEKIVNLNKKLSEQDRLLYQKDQSKIMRTSEYNDDQKQKEMLEAAERQKKLQSEIQQLIQKDLIQEKKILELMQSLNIFQTIRNDYDNAIKEQEILVRNNSTNMKTIESQRMEIARLQNIIASSTQNQQYSSILFDKSEQEKNKLEEDIQKSSEKNKILEEQVQIMKVSCQKLETAMIANCNQTKGWLEKYNKLEKSYINLQNQFRVEQQKQMMEKTIPSKRDSQFKSQQSLNKFRSELSETELNIQYSKNQELICQEVQNERDQLSAQNEELKKQINDLSNKNKEYQQQIQLLVQQNSMKNEELGIQNKDLMNKLNLMINENYKLIEANNERPILVQKIMQLTQQLEYLKSNPEYNNPILTQVSHFENSILSLQPPTSFNSAVEEAKWFKLRCSQLEVKLKVKSEEYADLIYQNKQLKRQMKQSPSDELTIKSSLYQTIQQSNSSNLIKQPGRFQNETVINANRPQMIYENIEESRGCCCDKSTTSRNYETPAKNNLNEIDVSQSERESVSCHNKCL